MLNAADKPNVLLICIDDLRPELKSFGVDYIHSPHIDRLAALGRPFFSHYVQAPTCGASRFTLLTGRYGSSGNGALFGRARSIKYPSFPALFRENGYTTVSVGKVSHHLVDEEVGIGTMTFSRKCQTHGTDTFFLLELGSTHVVSCSGLANGEIRRNAGYGCVPVSFDGPDTAYPDGLIIDEALKQLNELGSNAEKNPFFLAVGIIRPHLPFGAPAK